MKKNYLLLLVLLGIIGISMCSIFESKNNLTSITLESLFIENGEYNVFDNFSLSNRKNSEISAHERLEEQLNTERDDSKGIRLEHEKATITRSFDHEELRTLTYVFHLDSRGEEEVLSLYNFLENKMNTILGSPSKIDICESNFYGKTVYWDGYNEDNNSSLEILLDINVDSYSGDYIIQIICLKKQ